MSSDQLEDIMSALNEMGVNIVENEEAGEDGETEERARCTQFLQDSSLEGAVALGLAE